MKRYRGAAANAVDGISFEVPDASFFCLLGPNGAGKTTTVSILSTTLQPTTGEVRVAGYDLSREQTAIRASLGVLSQQPSLDLNLTAEENVRLHAVLYGLHPWRPLYRWMPVAYRGQVEALAGVLGVADLLGRRVRSLSGGTRRRLEIVRALMHRPGILMLDEPTAGLDPEARRSLWEHLDGARRELGTTIFLTTHYLHEAETADRVCVLFKGRVLTNSTSAELKGEGVEVWVDAADRAALLRALAGLGCSASGAGPFLVRLKRRTAQEVISGLGVTLTVLRVVEPTLEDAYLRLLERARN